MIYGRYTGEKEFSIYSIGETLLEYEQVLWLWCIPFTAGPEDQDYIPDSREETFNPRSLNQIACTTFIIIDDNIFPTLVEADEFFVVTLTSNDNVDVILGESSANITIQDNDGMHLQP